MKRIKQINMLFLFSVLLMVIGSLLASFLAISKIKMPILVNIIISQSMLVLPGLIYILIFNSKDGIKLPFHNIKIGNVFLIFIYTELCIPLVTSINVLSQMFTENAVVSVSDQMMDVPFGILLIVTGVIAPFCEELVFRGIIFNGFSKISGRIVISAFVSGIFFGLMHLNINQCCYAFVLGVVFAITDEILGSIWPSIIMHCVINSQNIAMLYVVDLVMKRSSISLSEAYAEQATNKSMLLIVGIFYLAIALFTTSLALVLLYGMANIQKREHVFTDIFSFKKNNTVDSESLEEQDEPKRKIRVVTVAGYAGIAICVFVMFFLEPIVKMLAK